MSLGGPYLSKREQQIMELAYARSQLTATELVDLLPGNPSNATVRSLLRILEEKGQLQHREEAGKFIYEPTGSKEVAGTHALQRLVDVFFQGSASTAMVSLLRESPEPLSAEEISHLEKLIAEAKARQ